MTKGMVATIHESGVWNFVKEMENRGSKVYSVKKLSTLKKKLYGFGKNNGNYYVVDVAPTIGIDEFVMVARSYQQVYC